MTADTVMAGDAAEEAPQFVQANSSSGLEYLLHPVRTPFVSDQPSSTLRRSQNVS